MSLNSLMPQAPVYKAYKKIMLFALSDRPKILEN